MSYALSYQEPNRLPAGLLALTVHAAFFAMLMFGLRWQTLPPENYAVELWDSLPSINPVPEQMPAPPTEPIPEQLPAPPPEPISEQLPATPPEPIPQPALKPAPQQPAKAEIELREKKVSKAKPGAKELKARRKEEELRQLAEHAEKRRQDVQAGIRAEVAAATAAEVGRYQDMIRSKIRRNIVMPPDVSENAEAIFKVTLLPGGMVMDVAMLKSSGNAAYDNAAERAIYKAQPLPLPTDTVLQQKFRELKLTIRPEER